MIFRRQGASEIRESQSRILRFQQSGSNEEGQSYDVVSVRRPGAFRVILFACISAASMGVYDVRSNAQGSWVDAVPTDRRGFLYVVQ